MYAETSPSPASPETSPDAVLAVYERLTLESDAAKFHYAKLKERDLGPVRHMIPPEMLGRTLESSVGAASSEDLMDYFIGGRRALREVLEDEHRQSLGLGRGSSLSAEDSQAIISRANRLTNQIKLKQEGYPAGPELQAGHLQIFQLGARFALGTASKNQLVGDNKERDITAALEGRYNDLSEVVGLGLVSVIQHSRLERMILAHGIHDSVADESANGRFRHRRYVADNDPSRSYVRSRHDILVDPIVPAYDEKGNPLVYKPRHLTAAKYAIGGALKAVTAKPIEKLKDERSGTLPMDAMVYAFERSNEANGKSRKWAKEKMVRAGAFTTALVAEVPTAIDNILAQDEIYNNLDEDDKDFAQRSKHEVRMQGVPYKEAGKAVKRAWQNRAPEPEEVPPTEETPTEDIPTVVKPSPKPRIHPKHKP